jgi:hypothetical protein
MTSQTATLIAAASAATAATITLIVNTSAAGRRERKAANRALAIREAREARDDLWAEVKDGSTAAGSTRRSAGPGRAAIAPQAEVRAERLLAQVRLDQYRTRDERLREGRGEPRCDREGSYAD